MDFQCKRIRHVKTDYEFFLHRCYEEQKKNHPQDVINFFEFSKQCADKWKSMPSYEKLPFIRMASNDKVRYEKELAELDEVKMGIDTDEQSSSDSGSHDELPKGDVVPPITMAVEEKKQLSEGKSMTASEIKAKGIADKQDDKNRQDAKDKAEGEVGAANSQMESLEGPHDGIRTIPANARPGSGDGDLPKILIWDLENVSVAKKDIACCVRRMREKFFGQSHLGDLNIVISANYRHEDTLMEFENSNVLVTRTLKITKNSADKIIKQKMTIFSDNHNHKCQIIIISNDGGFAPAIKKLTMKGARIILIHTSSVSRALKEVACSAMDINSFVTHGDSVLEMVNPHLMMIKCLSIDLSEVFLVLDAEKIKITAKTLYKDKRRCILEFDSHMEAKCCLEDFQFWFRKSEVVFHLLMECDDELLGIVNDIRMKEDVTDEGPVAKRTRSNFIL